MYIQKAVRDHLPMIKLRHLLGRKYLQRDARNFHIVQHDEHRSLTHVEPKWLLQSESTSPAINSSANYPAILDIPNIDDDPTLLLDIEGQARPSVATQKDVGADEFGAIGPVTNCPLVLADVGPSYCGGLFGGTVPPAITAQPQSQTVIAGSLVVFSVTATGAAPIAYQWKKANVNILVLGATANVYNIESAQATFVGGYTVVASNAAGIVTSNVAMLTVNMPQPQMSSPSQVPTTPIPTGNPTTSPTSSPSKSPTSIPTKSIKPTTPKKNPKL